MLRTAMPGFGHGGIKVHTAGEIANCAMTAPASGWASFSAFLRIESSRPGSSFRYFRSRSFAACDLGLVPVPGSTPPSMAAVRLL